MSHRLSPVVLACLCLGVILAAAAWADDKNLMPNASFEVVGDNKMPIAWEFHPIGDSGATCAVDATVGRSGTHSVKLTNPHVFAPNVYGTMSSWVRVKPSTTYTFSLYAKSDDPGTAWFGCGKDWE